jgi:cytochrome c
MKIVMAVAALTALPFIASAAPSAAQLTSCQSCHLPDKGPTFKQIAQKYKNKPDAMKTVSMKIRDGSKGTWGKVQMPPNPKLSDAESKDLAAWVLQQK